MNKGVQLGAAMFEIAGGIIVLTIVLLFSGLKVVKEYDRLIVFRFGKALAIKGPGLHLVLPIIDRPQLIDVRMVTMPMGPLEELTMDEHSIKVSLLCMFHVADPKRAVLKIDDPQKATREFVKVTLRHFVRQHALRQIISERRRNNSTLKALINKQTREWGVHVHTLEIENIQIPKDVKRHLAQVRRHVEREKHYQHGEADNWKIHLSRNKIVSRASSRN